MTAGPPPVPPALHTFHILLWKLECKNIADIFFCSTGRSNVNPWFVSGFKMAFFQSEKIRQMSSLNSVLIWVLRSTIIGNFVANIKVHTLGCTASKKRFTYSSFDLDLGFFFSKTTFLLVHFLSLCCIDDANFLIFEDDRHIKRWSSCRFSS